MNFGGKVPRFKGKSFEFGEIIDRESVGKSEDFLFKEKSLGCGKFWDLEGKMLIFEGKIGFLKG